MGFECWRVVNHFTKLVRFDPAIDVFLVPTNVERKEQFIAGKRKTYGDLTTFLSTLKLLPRNVMWNNDTVVPFIGNIDITYDQMQSINCYKYVEYVRLIVLFENIWWPSQYKCALQKLMNDIVWQLNI